MTAIDIIIKSAFRAVRDIASTFVHSDKAAFEPRRPLRGTACRAINDMPCPHVGTCPQDGRSADSDGEDDMDDMETEPTDIDGNKKASRPSDDGHVLTEEKRNSARTASFHSSLTKANVADTSWIDESKKDAELWRKIIITDSDALAIDWNRIASLPLREGIGFAHVGNVDIDTLTGDEAVGLLDRDYILRRKMEAVYTRMRKQFVFDHEHTVPSFRFARAIAYANRRLNDEIEHLCMRCEQTGVEYDSSDDNDNGINEERKRIWRKESRSLNKKERYRWERQLADDVSNGDGKLADRLFKELSSYDRKWLPGDDANACFGIDIETTGLDEYRDYILDIGYEYMDVNPVKPFVMHADAVSDGDGMYAEEGYRPSGAYGAGRQMFGMPDERQMLGNPVSWLTGIEPATVAGKVPFDEDLNAQHALLAKLKATPYVAHNANYEHKHFMANVDGYAEAYRDGEIIIIDTMCMSKRWDDKTGFENHGSNRLEDYAKRWSGLDDGGSERHLGFEDAHIMLVAMRNHLKALHAEGEGPWNPLIPIRGIGGKHLHRRESEADGAGDADNANSPSA